MGKFMKTNASDGMGLAAAFMILASFLLNIYVAQSDFWAINDIEGVVVQQVRRSQGLFFKCTYDGTGQRACEDYDQFFVSLPGQGFQFF